MFPERPKLTLGFTLIEVLVVLGLFVIVAGLGFQYLRADPNRASAIGLAEELAQELQGARDEAISEQVPVGVAFPTNSGSVYLCKGIYVLKGEDVPRISRSLRFDSGYGDTAVCVGQWPTPDTDAPVLRADGEDFDHAAWLSIAAVSDPTIIFLPSGAVLSNLPSYDARYGLLVSTRFELAGSTVSSAHRAETVWVNALGEIVVETGAPPSVNDRDAGSTSGAAFPPPLQNPGPDAPVITQVRSEPDFSDGIYDPGIWGGVRQGEYATLVVESTDPNGGPLHTEWTGPGQFSSSTEGRMEWNEDGSVWRSTWTWSPPNGSDPPGTTVYDLSCRVRDPQGNQTPSSPAQSPRFLLSSDNILAVHDRVGANYRVLLMTEEGHVTHEIPLAGQSPSPVNLNRDGTSFLVYDSVTPNDSVTFYRINGEKMGTMIQGRQASLNVAQNEIISSHPVAAATEYLQWHQPEYGTTQQFNTPGATAIYPVKHNEAIVADVGSSSASILTGLTFFLTTDVDPFAERVIIETNSENIAASFSPDGSWIIYPIGGELHAVPNPPFTMVSGLRQPAIPLTLVGPSNVSRGVNFSPVGNEILFLRQNGGNQELWRAPIDFSGTSPVLLSLEQVSRRNLSPSARGLCWFIP